MGIVKFACRGDAEADGFAIEGVARIQPGGKGTVRADRQFGKAQAVQFLPAEIGGGGERLWMCPKSPTSGSLCSCWPLR